MTNARHRFSPEKDRRIPILVAVIFGLVGVLLVTLGACSSQPGPPQPTAAAAGVIDSAPAVMSSGSAIPSALPDTRSASSGSAGSAAVAPTTAAPTPAAPTPAASTTTASTASSSSKAAPAAPAKAAPTKTAPIVVPSFTTTVKGLILQESKPVSLSIPALEVKSALLDLGLNSDGTVQVPSLTDPDSKAGWYKNSPTPGSVGPAIILGHIDSKQFGPGVFYELGNLKPGAEVDVTRQDGTVAVFKIDGVRSYPKNNFPTKEVYGNIDHAGLRLITCGGTFDPSKRSYESNIVAYASLVSSRKA